MASSLFPGVFASQKISARPVIVRGAVAAGGGRILRGGAFKVRTSPTAFQGLGWDGWRLLREAADAFRRSLRARPGNRDAAWNLELALRRIREQEEQQQQQETALGISLGALTLNSCLGFEKPIAAQKKIYQAKQTGWG